MNPSEQKRNISKVIILGHTGFIGDYVIRRFEAAHPDYELIGLSSRALDLTEERAVHTLSELADERTAIIMCSAIKRHVEDSLRAFQLNMKMAINLVQFLQENSIARFLYFSSVSVYGENRNDLAITEATPIRPITYYGIAKYSSECLFNKVLEERDDFSLVTLRPSLVYGPGDECEHYRPSAFVKSILSTQSLEIWGDGQEKRDFIYVKDIAELTYRLTFNQFEGTINLVTGESHSFNQVIDTLAEVIPEKLTLNHIPRTRPKVSQGFNNEKIIHLFNDFKFTPFTDGIKETYKIVRKQFNGASEKIGT